MGITPPSAGPHAQGIPGIGSPARGGRRRPNTDQGAGRSADETALRRLFGSRPNLNGDVAQRRVDLLFSGRKIGPQRLDILGIQHIAPGRHVVPAVRHRFTNRRRSFFGTVARSIAHGGFFIRLPWQVAQFVA